MAKEVRLLLDTHVLLWAISNVELLSKKVQKAITDERNELVVSVISLWEIQLKIDAGKLSSEFVPSLIQEHLRLLGVSRILDFNPHHLSFLATLPNLHKEPFDRILLAQAKAEQLTMVTADRVMKQYDVPSLW